MTSKATRNSQARFAYVGTYTRNAPGGWSAQAELSSPLGISVFSVNDRTGDLLLIQTVTSDNPAYVVIHPSQNYLYVLNEIEIERALKVSEHGL